MSSEERTVRITLVKSLINRTEVQKATVRALGLRKIHSSVIQKENPQIRGMINRVSHMVRVEEVDAQEAQDAQS